MYKKRNQGKNWGVAWAAEIGDEDRQGGPRQGLRRDLQQCETIKQSNQISSSQHGGWKQADGTMQQNINSLQSQNMSHYDESSPADSGLCSYTLCGSFAVVGYIQHAIPPFTLIEYMNTQVCSKRCETVFGGIRSFAVGFAVKQNNMIELV